MATIKDIKIYRNWGKRLAYNTVYCGVVWRVEKGEPYDLVQFSINELGKPYFWNTSLCFPCGMSEEEIKKECVYYAQQSITEKDIKDYQYFLECVENWG